MKKLFKKARNSASKVGIAAAAMAMSAASSAATYVTGTELDDGLTDVGTLGGMFLGLCIAVAIFVYLKRTAR